MADDSMALLETLRKAGSDGDVDVLREGVRIRAQAIMEAEVSELTGLPRGERDPERRLTHCNGYRERRWDTGWARSTSPSRASGTGRTCPAARAQATGRAGDAGGRPGGVPRRRVHPAGGRPGVVVRVPDESGPSAAAALRRALVAFEADGIVVERGDGRQRLGLSRQGVPGRTRRAAADPDAAVPSPDQRQG